MAMIPVAAINLDRATERWAFMRAQSERLGIRLDRAPAVSVETLPEEAVLRFGDTWERPLRRVELALFLSHRMLWERAADSRTGLVVLEDDALLSRRFPDFLSAAPVDADIVNLEYYGRRKFFRRIADQRSQSASLRFTPVARDKSGSAAYYVSPAGAERLLAAAESRAAPSDAFLFQSGLLSVRQAEPALAVQAHIARELGIEPGIATQTQIQSPRDRLALTGANAMFHWRRLRTQATLLPYQLGRLGLYDFRKPEIALEDFRSPAAAQLEPAERQSSS